MNSFNLNQIGSINQTDGKFQITVDEPYRKALLGLKGFSHIVVLWWSNKLDAKEYRGILECEKPYKHAPDTLGIFATRSPLRPNPISITMVAVKSIDYETGIIETYWIDADEDTPLLDIKPYTPSNDRVSEFTSPEWCAHFPQSVEESESFPWEEEFNF